MSDYKPHPLRVQRKRTKGYKLPPDTVVVTRPTKWGNPFKPSDSTNYTVQDAVDDFRDWIDGKFFSPHEPDHGKCPTKEEIRAELRGKRLACFCPLDNPCHADVLAEIANGAE
jgi:hypothetical protein